MTDRSQDWLNQTQRDIAQARDSQAAERYEWACFASHQAAEKAAKALHLHLKQEAWGHVVAQLLMDIRAEPHMNIMGFYRAIRQLNMPVRSLSSSALKWPEIHKVHEALCTWAYRQALYRPEILQVGYIGSNARGDWGVGSDLDLILIIESSEEPFWRRALDFNFKEIPVPVDFLVYTQQEWYEMAMQPDLFYRTVQSEAAWVYMQANFDRA
jgi:HEPN domain-containing protein